MNGAFIASFPGVCGLCGKRTKTGARIWYDGTLADSANRRCEDCVTFDLFGAAS